MEQCVEFDVGEAELARKLASQGGLSRAAISDDCNPVHGVIVGRSRRWVEQSDWVEWPEAVVSTSGYMAYDAELCASGGSNLLDRKPR